MNKSDFIKQFILSAYFDPQYSDDSLQTLFAMANEAWTVTQRLLRADVINEEHAERSWDI